jgi:ribonuclease HIII
MSEAKKDVASSSDKIVEIMRREAEIRGEAQYKINAWSRFLKDAWNYRYEEHIARISDSVGHGDLMGAIMLCITLQQKAELIHLATKTITDEWIKTIKEAMKKLEELR